jgi:two-component system OmpR family response regulator
MPHRVLIVEDDRSLRTFLEKAFREEGYHVEGAASGDDGLAAAIGGEHSCIVLDRNLPGRDGMSVLAALRADGRRTPVVLLTAQGDPAERVRGLEAGADDYLPKPFDLAELLARVQALIRRAAMAHEELLIKVGRLIIDPVHRRVTVDGRRVELTPREFALLEYLARNAGRTLSRARIAEAVWQYQFDSETNVVDVYVNYVRKKLGAMDDGTEIVTVRGVGYRMEGP